MCGSSIGQARLARFVVFASGLIVLGVSPGVRVSLTAINVVSPDLKLYWGFAISCGCKEVVVIGVEQIGQAGRQAGRWVELRVGGVIDAGKYLEVREWFETWRDGTMQGMMQVMMQVML